MTRPIPVTLPQWMRWMERRVAVQERRQTDFYDEDYAIGGGGGGGGTGGGLEIGDVASRFYQTTASNVWNITHGLGFRPNVTVVDSSGTQAFPATVRYPDNNTVTLTFSAALGGEAYLS